METKQPAINQVARTAVWLLWSLDSGELYNKNCIVKTSERFIISSTFCCSAWSDKSGRNKRGVIRTANRATIVFTAQVDVLNSCWPSGVHN